MIVSGQSGFYCNGAADLERNLPGQVDSDVSMGSVDHSPYECPEKPLLDPTVESGYCLSAGAILPATLLFPWNKITFLEL